MGNCCHSQSDNVALQRPNRNTDTKPLLGNEQGANQTNPNVKDEQIESEDQNNVDDLLDSPQPSSTNMNGSSENKAETSVATEVAVNSSVSAAEAKQKEISLADVKLDVEHVREYIGQLSGVTLSIYWYKVDLRRADKIDTNDQLIRLFKEIIHGYVETVANKEVIKLLEATIANLSEDFANHYLNAMDNYSDPDMNFLHKKSFDKFFIQYVLFPQPMDWEKYQRSKRGNKAEAASKFDMLAYISSSPTIRGRPQESFDAKALAQELREILEGSSGSRGDRFADLVLSLSCTQRVAVRDVYKNSRDQSLQEHLSSSLGKDETRIALSLFRSFAENDAYWVNEALKSNDFDLIDEIIFTKTNTEIERIKQAYQKMFDGDMTLVLVTKTKRSEDDYHLLVDYALTLKREEIDPHVVNERQVMKDYEALKNALEGGKTLDMTAIYDIFTHRSWAHLDQVLIEFNKFSKINARSLVEKKIGGRVGTALQIMIDIAQQRHAYWALNLKKSMKGLGTNDELLVRCVVGRSEIDLQEIIVVFNTKFGEGKTLLQWLRDDTSGAYRKILMGLCGFDFGNLGGNSATHRVTDNVTAETEAKVDTNDNKKNDNAKPSSTTTSTTLKPTTEEIKDIESWDDHCVTSPTIRFNDDMDIDVSARLLAELAAEKKPNIKKFKKELIELMTSINNEQRQELKLKFQSAPANTKKTSLEDVITHILGKRGKTTAIALVMLTPTAQYRAQIVHEGLKHLPVLIETICTCTNRQLKETIQAYNTLYKGDMVGDINKATKSKKNLNSMIMEILKAQRPETLRVDVVQAEKDAKELKDKGESSKTDAGLWEHFFASKSLTHIKKTAELYAKISELTIMSVAHKVLGNNSFIAADTIFQMATNRFAFFAIKLRDSMKGVGYKADMLTRVLVLRSEIDMGEVQQEFDKSPDQTNNKTLLQWLTDDLSGSFLALCLRLSGLHSTKPHPNDSDTEYSTVVRHRATTTEVAHDAMTEDDENDHTSDTSKTIPLSNSYGTEQSPQPSYDTDAETPRKSWEESKKSGIIARPPLTFKVDEFASFVQRRMNEATVNKIWAHLDADNSGEIEKEELLSLLVFTCVLFQAFIAKTNKQDTPKIDKKAMKDELKPMRDWIVEYKMINKESIQKSEFTTVLGGWIMEYHQEILSQ